jgi:integrase
MANKFLFTKKRLEAIPLPPDGKRVTVMDAETKGLICTVTSAGTRTFYFRRQVNGKRATDRLGALGEITLATARDMVALKQADIAKGLPVGTAATIRTSPKFDDHFKAWLKDYAEVHRPGTVYHDRKLYEKHIKDELGDRKLVTITMADVQKLHSKIGKAGKKRTANNVLQLLSTIFNRAIQAGQYNGRNPVDGIRRFKERKRERYLSPDELERLFKALFHKDTPADVRDIVLLALLTGARRGNIFAMEWAEVDDIGALWTIPGKKTKTDDDYRIPLVPMVLEILATRRAARKDADNPWVFPATSATGHVYTIQKQWVAVLDRAKIKNFRFHDLRHTNAAWQIYGGATLSFVGKVLGHRSTSTTARYAHVDMTPARASAERGAGRMLEFGAYDKALKDGADSE